jgi:hypothetical protein
MKMPTIFGRFCYWNMTKKEFKKLNLASRYKVLKNEGTHLASREFGGYFVHLFGLHDFYVEVWVMIGLNQIRWIELQENQDSIDLYIDKMDISGLFR